jgi:predicted nucleotidyltransferase
MGHVCTVQERIEANREEIYRLVELYRTTNPRVFGSVARGEARPDSDVDILVDALPGATLFHLGGLQCDLEEVLGVQVDLLASDSVPGSARNHIISEAVPL